MDTACLFFHSTWVGRQNAGSYRCNYHFGMALAAARLPEYPGMDKTAK
jgi:hypothetical protein